VSRKIFISNRLPVTVSKREGVLEYNKSIGGLATGLKSFHEQSDSIWVGWSGISNEIIDEKEKENIKKELVVKYNCMPVFLSEKEIDQYYYGFSNETIWPLFHYFADKVEYNPETWISYKKVNNKFFDTIEPFINEDDIIWIHDYQLMLLPQIIKEKYPSVKVGFFLHIPFPSFEIFRLLIWREEILKGLLGSDLIGFHTYDYVRHFLSSAHRLLGLEHNLNRINYEDRYIKVDVFPMGIDYERFSRENNDIVFRKEVNDIADSLKRTKMILSIDRLDYTKGIPGRIRAFSRFLTNYPEYKGQVKLYLIVAPSREKVDSYEEIRREIEELVSQVNGKHGTVKWMPIWFFFYPFKQEKLMAFYKNADVLLVTPLRDGMNLVVKEYIASRTDYEGMVVISETAGAASELSEAVIVNANDYDAIAKGIKTALDMPKEERIAINKLLNKRLKRYNVEFWASEFLSTLNDKSLYESDISAQRIVEEKSMEIENAYKKAKKRILFLDYDGTLIGFTSRPEKTKPDIELMDLLINLSNDPKNTIVIISGRDRFILDEWLGTLNLHIVASHGLWVRHPKGNWKLTTSISNEWKDSIKHMLEVYLDRMPGAMIEDKEYSVAFHYRQCQPDMVAANYSEIKASLISMTQSMSLGIQEGNKVLEIKDNRVDKGQGAALFLRNNKYDFILGAGDDYTDEDLFSVLPKSAYTIKIGLGNTHANYFMKSWKSMRLLLRKLIENNN
jgi:trehalose 6-phosphate synthase/phosphatase